MNQPDLVRGFLPVGLANKADQGVLRCGALNMAENLLYIVGDED